MPPISTTSSNGPSFPRCGPGLVVLADRYTFTLTARAAVRGIDREYLRNLYQLALRPQLTFWLDVSPKVAFAREFKKTKVISYWEAGRDMNLSQDLYESFVQYQGMLNEEFEYLSGQIRLPEGKRRIVRVGR